MNIEKIESIVKNDGIIFLAYGGFLTQALISGMTEALEKEVERNELTIGPSTNIFTIFIELTQNMMNYSKTKNGKDITSEGLIIVGKEGQNQFFIHSQNLIKEADRKQLEPRLEELMKLDKEEVKKRYRELRRAKRDENHNGAGIGFYEIAKRCDSISYEFNKVNDNVSYFHFRANVVISK